MKPFVLALDFGGTKIAIAAATEDRVILDRVQMPTGTMTGGEALHKALHMAYGLSEKWKAASGADLAGVAVSTMGLTLPDRVMMAPNVPGWEQLRVEETLREYFPDGPLAIENDVKVAAFGEVKRGALAHTSTGLYVNLGTGIAVTYTMGNQIVRGHNGAAGEIAYCLKRPDEPAGFREGRQPLEEYIGGKGVGERATQALGRRLTAAEVFELARHDPAAKVFVTDLLNEIAYHLTNTVIAWNPERVAIGGGFVRASDMLIRHLTDWFDRFVPFPPAVVPSHFMEHASLYGAIELAWSTVESGIPN